MKIFVAGALGQLGHDCLEVFSDMGSVRGADLPDLDIADRASVARLIDAFRPDWIINAAAFTAVDAAETEREAAWRVNAEGPRVLAEYARAHGARLAHVSTDYVFDGSRPPPTPYTEDDGPAPRCWYGVTKRAGEEAVQEVDPAFLVFRTAWLYGAQGHNFLRTILRQAIRNPERPLRVVNDQYGTPTWSRRLAQQMAAVIAARGNGLYHATAEGACTWFDVARTFLDAMGIAHRVEPCTTAEYPTAAERPRNAILENARLRASGLCVMRPWMEDLVSFSEEHGAAWRREMEGGDA